MSPGRRIINEDDTEEQERQTAVFGNIRHCLMHSLG